VTRATRIAVLALVTLAGAVACGRESDDDTDPAARARLENGRWAAPDELRWLERFAAWSVDFERAFAAAMTYPRDNNLLAAGAGEVLEDYEAALDEARHLCGDGFRKQVGEPPTRRLAEVANRVRDGCEHFGRGAEATLRFFREKDEKDAATAKAEFDDFERTMTGAGQLIPPGERQRLPAVASSTPKSRIDPRYGRAASAVVGANVEVRCWSKRDWPKLLKEERLLGAPTFRSGAAGVTRIGGTRINLAPPVCLALDLVVYEMRRPSGGQARLAAAFALVTLAHEAQHAKGVVEEPKAECYGMQLADETARELGIEPRYADTLPATYWAHYPLDEVYASKECRNGGEFDLIVGGPWP
jgi:hypothetical protein